MFQRQRWRNMFRRLPAQIKPWSHPHAVIQTASVIPISGEESAKKVKLSEASGRRRHLVQPFFKTGDAQPIRQRLRPLPKAGQAAADQMQQEMRDAGINEPSEGLSASPVRMAPKKDWRLRFCVEWPWS